MSFLQPENLGTRGGEFYGRHETQVNRAGFRSVTPDLYTIYDRAIGGDMVRWQANPSLSVTTRNDYYVNFGYAGGVDRRYIASGFPEFRNNSGFVYLGRAPSSWGSFELNYNQGTYYGEYYHNYGGAFSVIPWPVWVVEADATAYNPRSDERFYVSNLKSTLTVTEGLFWRVILQGDSDARTALGSTLWGWEFRPGSTAYLAYEQKRDATGHFALADQLVFLKVSYLITF
jgi:hypothetical protein